MNEITEYIYIIRATRPGFAEEPLPEEIAIMGEHFEYLKGLYEQGKVILVGPALDRTFGIGVFKVNSEAEAREIAENDPAVKKGVMSFTLHPFRVALLAGRD